MPGPHAAPYSLPCVQFKSRIRGGRALPGDFVYATSVFVPSTASQPHILVPSPVTAHVRASPVTMATDRPTAFRSGGDDGADLGRDKRYGGGCYEEFHSACGECWIFFLLLLLVELFSVRADLSPTTMFADGSCIRFWAARSRHEFLRLFAELFATAAPL